MVDENARCLDAKSEDLVLHRTMPPPRYSVYLNDNVMPSWEACGPGDPDDMMWSTEAEATESCWRHYDAVCAPAVAAERVRIATRLLGLVQERVYAEGGSPQVLAGVIDTIVAELRGAR